MPQLANCVVAVAIACLEVSDSECAKHRQYRRKRFIPARHQPDQALQPRLRTSIERIKELPILVPDLAEQ